MNLGPVEEVLNSHKIKAAVRLKTQSSLAIFLGAVPGGSASRQEVPRHGHGRHHHTVRPQRGCHTTGLPSLGPCDRGWPACSGCVSSALNHGIEYSRLTAYNGMMDGAVPWRSNLAWVRLQPIYL